MNGTVQWRTERRNPLPAEVRVYSWEGTFVSSYSLDLVDTGGGYWRGSASIELPPGSYQGYVAAADEMGHITQWSALYEFAINAKPAETAITFDVLYDTEPRVDRVEPLPYTDVITNDVVLATTATGKDGLFNLPVSNISYNPSCDNSLHLIETVPYGYMPVSASAKLPGQVVSATEIVYPPVTSGTYSENNFVLVRQMGSIPSAGPSRGLAVPAYEPPHTSALTWLMDVLRQALEILQAHRPAAAQLNAVLSAPPAGQIWKTYYFAGSTRVAMHVEGDPNPANNGVFYFAADHLGSTSLTMDANGVSLGTMGYKPFGETRMGTTPTDRRFTGQREESSLGSLYDYGARFYSPALGRFLSADTIVPSTGDPQQLNRFSYVRNNPLRHIDPSGHMCLNGPLGDTAGPCQGPSPQELPESDSGNYWSPRYGYFDRSHFVRGQASTILESVRRLALNGGGAFEVSQGIGSHGIVANFHATYEVAPFDPAINPWLEDYIIQVSLGIFENFQSRFEMWEGTLFSLMWELTGYAPEDLPSTYVAFTMEALDMTEEQAFAYLQPIYATGDPPRCWGFCDNHNREFTPLYSGKHVPWPDELTITPISTKTGAWRFLRSWSEQNSLTEWLFLLFPAAELYSDDMEFGP